MPPQSRCEIISTNNNSKFGFHLLAESSFDYYEFMKRQLLALILIIAILGVGWWLLEPLFSSPEGATKNFNEEEGSFDPNLNRIYSLQKDLKRFYENCKRFPSDEEGLEILKKPGFKFDCPRWVMPLRSRDNFLRELKYKSLRNNYEIIYLGKDKKVGGEGLNQDYKYNKEGLVQKE